MQITILTVIRHYFFFFLNIYVLLIRESCSLKVSTGLFVSPFTYMMTRLGGKKLAKGVNTHNF